MCVWSDLCDLCERARAAAASGDAIVDAHLLQTQASNEHAAIERVCQTTLECRGSRGAAGDAWISLSHPHSNRIAECSLPMLSTIVHSNRVASCASSPACMLARC